MSERLCELTAHGWRVVPERVLAARWAGELVGFLTHGAWWNAGNPYRCAVHRCAWRVWAWYPAWRVCAVSNGDYTPVGGVEAHSIM